MRQNSIQEAMATAEQALKIAPANARPTACSASSMPRCPKRAARTRAAARPTFADENVTKAMRHLEQAIEHPAGQADPNVRATLARLYVASGAYDKAIPLLPDLVNQEPGWQDGPMLLAEAYAGAGRAERRHQLARRGSSRQPRLLPTLADFYARERRWPTPPTPMSRALQASPRKPPS